MTRFMANDETPQDEIIATLRPSPARRWLAVTMIGAFGALLLWIAATGAAGSLIVSVVFVGMAALSFLAANRLHSIRDIELILSRQGLFERDGRTLCRIEQIQEIDRSFFAFKPSNGFVVRLKEPMERTWVPGLWWRVGRRIGVGGVTSIGEAKAMSDMLTLLLKGPELLDGLHNPFAR